MLAIDLVIHEFHRSLIHRTSRPAGVNLIQGQLTDVVLFLDQLSYGCHLPSDVEQQRTKWRQEMDRTIFADLVEGETGENGEKSQSTDYRYA